MQQSDTSVPLRRGSDSAPGEQGGRNAAVTPRRADGMIKMNLPPLMGRRDAAYDCAAELMTSVLFAERSSREERHRICPRLLQLLETAEADTRAILAMLSSPDTEARERNQLACIEMFCSAVRTLYCFAELESRGFGSRSRFHHAASENTGLPPLKATESGVIARLHDLFLRSHERIRRYRGYAAKNFSAANAERHARSYRAYSELYHNENNRIPRNHELSN